MKRTRMETASTNNTWSMCFRDPHNCMPLVDQCSAPDTFVDALAEANHHLQAPYSGSLRGPPPWGLCNAVPFGAPRCKTSKHIHTDSYGVAFLILGGGRAPEGAPGAQIFGTKNVPSEVQAMSICKTRWPCGREQDWSAWRGLAHAFYLLLALGVLAKCGTLGF